MSPSSMSSTVRSALEENGCRAKEEVHIQALKFIFFGGSKLLLPGARPGSKTNFVLAKLYVHFYAMKIY